MTDKVSFMEIKEGFFLVSSPEVREYPWYLMRKPGEGTYAEVVKDVEVGIFIAPWPFNRRIVVESHTDPEQRRLWDESGIAEVILLAHDAIMAQLEGEA